MTDKENTMTILPCIGATCGICPPVNFKLQTNKKSVWTGISAHRVYAYNLQLHLLPRCMEKVRKSQEVKTPLELGQLQGQKSCPMYCKCWWSGVLTTPAAISSMIPSFYWKCYCTNHVLNGYAYKRALFTNLKNCTAWLQLLRLINLAFRPT